MFSFFYFYHRGDSMFYSTKTDLESSINEDFCSKYMIEIIDALIGEPFTSSINMQMTGVIKRIDWYIDDNTLDGYVIISLKYKFIKQMSVKLTAKCLKKDHFILKTNTSSYTIKFNKKALRIRNDFEKIINDIFVKYDGLV